MTAMRYDIERGGLLPEVFEIFLGDFWTPKRLQQDLKKAGSNGLSIDLKNNNLLDAFLMEPKRFPERAKTRTNSRQYPDTPQRHQQGLKMEPKWFPK